MSPVTRAARSQPSQPAPEDHLALVGERGLEPPTRSTQSYAPPVVSGCDDKGLGDPAAMAYPKASHEHPEEEPVEGDSGSDNELLSRLAPSDLRRLADLLERQQGKDD